MGWARSYEAILRGKCRRHATPSSERRTTNKWRTRTSDVNCDKEDLPKVVEHVANQGLELLHHLAKEIWCVPTY